MRRLSKIFTAIAVFSIIFTFSQEGFAEPPVIPRPMELVTGEETFVIDSSTRILLSKKDRELRQTADYFTSLIEKSSGWKLPIDVTGSKEQPNNTIFLDLTDTGLNEEGYTLTVTEDTIRISARTTAGLFYGLQTLRQLLPVQVESSVPVKDFVLAVPVVQISDMPRYGWRGLMLDESRHFFGKEHVFRLLDQMALFKLNRFHWHLTDSPGWRIEIKKYPKLTTVGGIGCQTDPSAPAQYYSQQDIKEIVAYAQQRHIVIIPEIDMPGHAAAANRAYPEYSGGGSKKHPEFTFNPGSEATYTYLENILTEVAELFPGPWLHLGGDEVHFGWEKWKTDPGVQALMKEKDFENLRQVEQYFVVRMADFINTLGKTTTGWDEISLLGVDKDKSLLMWWRHDKEQIRDNAIKAGYSVVLCPRIPCYLDFVQHDSHKVGRRWGGFSSLDKIIDFPTYPETYTTEDKKRIVGIQGNLWTETVKTTKRMEYMIFPRLLAIAESAWTPPERKNFEDFQTRLKAALPRLEEHGIYYFNPFEPAKTPEPMQ